VKETQMTSLLSAIPSGARASAPGSIASANGSRKASAAALSSFQTMFQGRPDDKTPDAASASDPTAQIAALLQSGMPLTTIVDRLANMLASAAQKLTGSTQNANDLRTTLQSAIAQALHPPGNAPPGTAAEQAAALAARLRQWITAIAREAGDAGQQNDIAGHILDAKSAKDIPAQAQGSKSSSSMLDADLLARSLMAQVAASLTQQPSQPPRTDSSSQASAPASNAPAQASQQNAASPVANAPDLLARMIVRAASVDMRINGNVALDTKGTLTPSVLSARFAAALESVVAHAAPSTQGGFNWSSFGRNSENATHAEMKAQEAPQFGIGVASNVSQANQNAQAAATAQPASVDAHAVIEALVKSLAMRTNAEGTSEMRLHLSPAHLGDLSMKITVQGGNITASVVAQNADVRNALVANHHQLARSLADAGLSLMGFSVDVSGGDAGSQQNRDRTAGFGRRFVVHELGAKNESETASIPSLGPALLPTTSLGLFNYLA
jgi:flagellar hook-length control protein FliK